MRTESSASSASAATRLRDEVARARRWVRGRGRATRLALIAVAAAALAGLAYWAIPLDRDERVWLYDGKKFSQDSAQAIEEALGVEKIAFVTDQSNRVGVARSRWSDALAALKKHDVEPPSLEEIEKATETASILDTPYDRADREHRRLERSLKAMIENYEGIRSAYVKVIRTPGHGSYRVGAAVSGLVQLDTERKPPHRVIQSIQTLLSKRVPGLSPDAVTVCDRAGIFYLEAGNPKAATATQSLAHAEELRDGLLEKLRELIPGVDVDVTVEPSTAPHPAAPPPLPAPPPPPPADDGRPNHPVEISPEADPAPDADRANVWVKVPRSYYLRIFRENMPNRQPSPDELALYNQKTRNLIESAVSMLVPKAERGEVRVDTILDDLGRAGPLVVPSGSADALPAWPSWAAPVALGAGVGLGVALILGTGLGMMAARRPAARPSRTTVRSGVVVDAPSGPVPGPSERVRDLVRRDPGAAAGVLQRWIGQGEGGPIG
jgi:type III secretory pathway lipoprotein EscJ